MQPQGASFFAYVHVDVLPEGSCSFPADVLSAEACTLCLFSLLMFLPTVGEMTIMCWASVKCECFVLAFSFSRRWHLYNRDSEFLIFAILKVSLSRLLTPYVRDGEDCCSEKLRLIVRNCSDGWIKLQSVIKPLKVFFRSEV